MVKVKPLNEEEYSPEKKKGEYKILKFCSIRVILLATVILFCFMLVIIGSISLFFYTDKSTKSTNIEKLNNFDALNQKVRNVMKSPKIMVDSIYSYIMSSNITNMTHDEIFEILYNSLENNFDRFDVDSMILYAADFNCDRLMTFWKFPAQFMYLRRFPVLDNVTAPELWSTLIDKNDGSYIPLTNATYPWSYEESFCNKAKKLSVKSFLYYTYCPDHTTSNLFCDFFFCYIIPKYVNGVLEGSIGSCIPQNSVKTYLSSASASGEKGSYNFMINVKDGVLLSTSKTTDDVLQKFANLSTSTIVANKASMGTVKNVATFILGQFYNDYNNVPTGISFQKEYGLNYVEFQRFDNEDNEDYIVVSVTPMWSYVGTSVTYGVSYTVILIAFTIVALVGGFLIERSITRPLFSLVNEMKKVENMKLEDIEKKYSMFGEVRNLQTNFYFLIDALKEYKTFLPSHLKTGSSSDDTATSKEIQDSTNSTGSVSSTGSSNSGKGSTSSSKGKISKNKFNYNIEKKYATVVHIYWKYNKSEVDLITKHVELSDIISKMLKLYKGVLLSFNDKEFTVGFNIHKYVDKHAASAAKFVLALLERVIGGGFKIHSSCVTGTFSVGILGSKLQKNQVVFGKFKDFGRKLCKHANVMNMPILINEGMMKNIKNSLANKREQFEITPFDLVAVHGKKTYLYYVFGLKKALEASNSEWMYEYDIDLKKKEHNSIFDVWRALKNDDLDTALSILKKLDKYPTLFNVVNKMKHQNLTFKKFIKKKKNSSLISSQKSLNISLLYKIGNEDIGISSIDDILSIDNNSNMNVQNIIKEEGEKADIL